jgi:Homeodomain-like domain
MFVHGAAIRTRALELAAAGVNDCEIARRLGIARTTVRDWRRMPYEKSRDTATCPRCERASRQMEFADGDYAELLGIYLGDGCISRQGRTWQLRISLDSRHTFILSEIDGLLRRCFPGHKVGRTAAHEGRCSIPWVYSSHLPCLFPQHGLGKKHERLIRLEPWQEVLVTASPWRFLRGCIWTDGCSFINRTGPYEYLSYDFANLSQGILDLFAHASDLVGVEYRRYERSIRIYRRASVALMEEHVGLKH